MAQRGRPGAADRIERGADRHASKTIDFAKLAADFRAAVRPEALDKLAVALGVSVESLRRLGVGWSAKHRAWAFPMSNAAGDVLGIRLRLPGGKKLSGKRRQGRAVHSRRCPLSDCPATTDCLLIAEGPTDTAALLDLGILGGRSPVMHGRRQAAGRVGAEHEALGRGDRGRRRRARPTRRGNLGGGVGRLLAIGADHHAPARA